MLKYTSILCDITRQRKPHIADKVNHLTEGNRLSLEGGGGGTAIYGLL